MIQFVLNARNGGIFFSCGRVGEYFDETIGQLISKSGFFWNVNGDSFSEYCKVECYFC